MHIILNNSSMVPIYEQLTSQIKASVINGESKPGEALPSVRTLAAELKISALTVKKSYDRLEEEGYVVTVHGKGSYIAQTDILLAEEARRQKVESELDEALTHAVSSGLSKEEILEIIDILLEDM